MNLQDEVWDFMKEARYRIAFALLMIGVTGVLLWEDFVSIYIEVVEALLLQLADPEV